jgi:Alpha/beta hydrolase of unknown function (DUF1400)
MAVSLQHIYHWFVRVTPRFVGLSLMLSATAIAIASAAPVHAADRITFTYGPLRKSVPVEDLATLVETGQVSSTLRFYLNFADIDPDNFRALLSSEVPLTLKFADEALNSLPGEYALFQLGNLASAANRDTNIQALRSAVVLSVSEDDRISLLEFLQNYPTQTLLVDGVEVARVARDVGNIVEDVEARLSVIAAAIEQVLPGLICQCQAGQPAPTDSVTQQLRSL